MALGHGPPLAAARLRDCSTDMEQEPHLVSRVLVVDDEPAIAQLVAEVLETDGYEVETAANGLVALEKLEARDYDLVLSDLRMPHLDGIGLYREIERRWPTLLARMLFISGSTTLPEYESFLTETAVPILLKPFALVDLQQVTRRVLAEPRRERERA
jgi:DNA-binding NtrC family response regulator